MYVSASLEFAPSLSHSLVSPHTTYPRLLDIPVTQIQTPLEVARKLSDSMGGNNTLLLKREDLQPVFSFKLRGAYNKMAKLPKDILAKGVITASAGNHAQGVALAAAKLVSETLHILLLETYTSVL